jgi:serine/threonine protein kinase
MLLYVPYKGEWFIIIKINSVNLESLEKVGKGKFGVVYKKDEQIAYKIYHETIVDLDWKEITNPALLLLPIHFKTLIKRSKNLVYSGGVLDTIKVDGKFRGVVIPYYDGEEFLNLIDKPIGYKVDLSKQLVRNAKELSKNWIYPTDYRLKNVLLTNGEVKIVDLDDSRTHPFILPGLLFKTISINALGNTIQSFLKEREHLYFPKEITDNLGRERIKCFYNYKRIEEYLSRKGKEKSIIYIDDNTDLSNISYFNLDNFVFVYVIDEQQLNIYKASMKIEQLKDKGIKLFDFVKKEEQNNYRDIENIDEEYEFKNKELKRIYKKKK